MKSLKVSASPVLRKNEMLCSRHTNILRHCPEDPMQAQTTQQQLKQKYRTPFHAIVTKEILGNGSFLSFPRSIQSDCRRPPWDQPQARTGRRYVQNLTPARGFTPGFTLAASLKGGSSISSPLGILIPRLSFRMPLLQLKTDLAGDSKNDKQKPPAAHHK